MEINKMTKLYEANCVKTFFFFFVVFFMIRAYFAKSTSLWFIFSFQKCIYM